ncbi:hypothetical protein VNO80_03818 [Phaseolus coccineus]|uniref:Uncharacterized protein n=1 Tax=Phaseolus coccineus TaxID=3886 RepID=A0AAN9RNB8_PHACN
MTPTSSTESSNFRFLEHHLFLFQTYRHIDKSWLGFTDLMEDLLIEEHSLMDAMELNRVEKESLHGSKALCPHSCKEKKECSNEACEENGKNGMSRGSYPSQVSYIPHQRKSIEGQNGNTDTVRHSNKTTTTTTTSLPSQPFSLPLIESEKLFVSIGFWEDPVDPILLGSDLGL